MNELFSSQWWSWCKKNTKAYSKESSWLYKHSRALYAGNDYWLITNGIAHYSSIHTHSCIVRIFYFFIFIYAITIWNLWVICTCLQVRMWQRDSRDRTVLQPTPAAAIDVSEPSFWFSTYLICFKFVYSFLHSINIAW